MNFTQLKTLHTFQINIFKITSEHTKFINELLHDALSSHTIQKLEKEVSRQALLKVRVTVVTKYLLLPRKRNV